MDPVWAYERERRRRLAGGRRIDGQDGVLGMPRYHADACREGCEECAAYARRTQSKRGIKGLASIMDDASCASFARKPARRARWRPSNDWAFGVA